MLYIVGIGGGSADGMTCAARAALEKSSTIVGYTVYNELVKSIYPDKNYIETGMRHEHERVRAALGLSLNETVSLICSGDSVVYGMAGLALELSVEYPDCEIEIIAGVTAALSGSAVLGAPLTNDFAVISLSDLLTPWEKIEKRILCASECDITTVLYNPSSHKRQDYLMKACDLMLKYKSPETVCGWVRNISRDGQEARIMTLAELRTEQVDMFTTVFIGCAETRVINGRMVTPRGYKNA